MGLAKKGMMHLLVLAVLFLVSGLMAMVALKIRGYVPDEALGQNQVRLLELKEDAVSALSRADHAVKYSSSKSVFDLMGTSLIKNPECGYHVNPLISGNCRYEEDIFEEYLYENYEFYTKNKHFVPEYEFKIETGDTTKIIAQPKSNLKVFERNPIILSGSVDKFDFWPSDSINLTSCYGEELDIKISGFTEAGDIAEVYAVDDGRVHSVCVNDCNVLTDNNCQESCEGFGTNVVISHTQGSVTRYSHLASIESDISEGEEVKEGDLLGLAGKSGSSNEQQIGFLMYPSISGLDLETSALSPLCFFSKDLLENIDFEDTASSCQEKYPDGFNASDPGQKLLAECQNLPVGSINEGVLGENGEKVLDKSVKYNEIITLASSEFQIPVALIKSVITIESHFEPNVRSISGPVGIMQFAEDTARRYGLNVVDCCSDEEVESRTCHLNTNWCTPDNDERFIPEKAIPAGAHLLSDLYHRYGQNVYLTALGYHSGQGAADVVHTSCPNLDPSNVEKCAADIERENEDSSTEAVVDYVKKMEKFYPAWGGLFSSSISFGSYYEVNPYTEAVIDFDLERFERVQTVAENIRINCEGSNDIENCVNDTAEEINNDIGEISPAFSCLQGLSDPNLGEYYAAIPDNFREKIVEFIIEYENCKNYDWEELSAVEDPLVDVPIEGCDCNIKFPDIDGLDIRMLPDRIQFIAEGSVANRNRNAKVLYEHITSPNKNSYDLNGFEGEGIFIYDDKGFLRGKKILMENGDEIIDNAKKSYLSRTKDGIVLKEYSNACQAQIRTYSYCYDTGAKLTGFNSATGKYELDTPIIVPFSVKID